MITLEEIHQIWAVDAKLRSEHLDEDSEDIASLHSKYLRWLSDSRMESKRLGEKRKALENVLTDYYLGHLDQTDCAKIGRTPWQHVETQTTAKKKVDTDAAVIKLNIQIAELDEKVLVLKDIINMINIRGYHIKNSIDFRKWLAGD